MESFIQFCEGKLRQLNNSNANQARMMYNPLDNMDDGDISTIENKKNAPSGETDTTANCILYDPESV